MPIFIAVERVLHIHAEQLRLHGGQAGVRDQALLESAVHAPAAGFAGQYVHPDVASMAGAYLFHINRNHPFLDGNKRTAVATAMVFLDLNGHAMEIPDQELIEVALAVASGTADKQAAIAFFRDRLPPAQP